MVCINYGRGKTLIECRSLIPTGEVRGGGRVSPGGEGGTDSLSFNTDLEITAHPF